MNIIILIITFLLLLEHTTIFFVDEINNYFTVLGLIIITIIVSFSIFGVYIWILILSLGVGLATITFIEELKRFQKGKEIFNSKEGNDQELY